MRYEFHPEALEEYRQVMFWYPEREQILRYSLLPRLKRHSASY
jgi:hypothetical protein